MHVFEYKFQDGDSFYIDNNTIVMSSIESNAADLRRLLDVPDSGRNSDWARLIKTVTRAINIDFTDSYPHPDYVNSIIKPLLVESYTALDELNCDDGYAVHIPAIMENIKRSIHRMSQYGNGVIIMYDNMKEEDVETSFQAAKNAAA